MTLNQLQYFVRVAESGRLTVAAQSLMIAQPSLTQAIRKLEGELSFSLFEKSGRTLTLTKEGREFLSYAREVLDAQIRAEAAAKRIFRESNGLIRFMHTEPTPRYYIPDLIRHFLSLPENLNVRIESDIAGTGKIVDALLADEIHFGFCSDPVSEDGALDMYPVLDQPIVLVAARGDPLCSLSRVSPEDLMQRPCISYASDSALRHQLDSYCAERRIRPDIRYCSSAVQINNLVARGLGWAFVVKTDNLPLDRISILNMPELNIRRTTYLAMRAGRSLGDAASRFRDFVISEAEADRKKE